MTFDLYEILLKQNFARYPLHHVIYASTKFEVATSNGKGEKIKLQEGWQTDGQTEDTDRRMRRRTHSHTDGQTTD